MRRVIVIAAIVIAGLAAVSLRVVIGGRTALAEADTAAAEGRLDDAIAGWESAARWYLPLAPHVDEAYTRLRELARADHGHALAAWRAVRSAALATRSLWTPHADDLATANAQIAELASRDPAGAAAGGPDAASRKTWHAQRLARDPRPRTGALVLAIAGVAAWLVGLGLVLGRGFDAAGHVVRRPALTGAGVTLAGMLAWLAGVYLA